VVAGGGIVDRPGCKWYNNPNPATASDPVGLEPLQAKYHLGGNPVQTKERLIFMLVGGFLVFAGQLLPNLFDNDVAAEGTAQNAEFGRVTCSDLIVSGSIVVEGVAAHTILEGDVIVVTETQKAPAHWLAFHNYPRPKIEIWPNQVVMVGKKGGYAVMKVGKKDSSVSLSSSDGNGGVGIHTFNRLLNRSEGHIRIYDEARRASLRSNGFVKHYE